jgi:hypothetical protein
MGVPSNRFPRDLLLVLVLLAALFSGLVEEALGDMLDLEMELDGASVRETKGETIGRKCQLCGWIREARENVKESRSQRRLLFVGRHGHVIWFEQRADVVLGAK